MKRFAPILTSLLTLALTTAAWACPMCKDSVPNSDAQAPGGVPSGFNTTIYFMLAASEFSRWHRVESDEIWHYHEGDAIELLLFDDRGSRRLRLGPVARETNPTVVVPAGTWQAARSTGAYTLCACTVGPGFVFADFSLAVDSPEIAAQIANAGPEWARFL